MLNLENPYAPLFWNRDAGTARHRAVLHTTWDLPFGRGRRYLANAPRPVDFVLGGWQLYWIAYLETGQYFSPSFSGADPSNTNTSGGLPDRIANGNLDRSDRKLTRWFDATAFVRPPAGRFGNSGVNILQAPGLHEHNLTIGKRFPITERFKFTFEAAMRKAPDDDSLAEAEIAAGTAHFKQREFVLAANSFGSGATTGRAPRIRSPTSRNTRSCTTSPGASQRFAGSCRPCRAR